MDNNTQKPEEVSVPSSESATVASTTKRESTKWLIIRVVLIVLGWKLMGIGGIIGASYASLMLPKVEENPTYSKGKKVGFFFLHSIIALVIATAIMLTLVYTIRHFYPAAGLKSNVESTYQAPAEYAVYKNENMGISALSYPGSWAVNEQPKEEYAVNFTAPDQNNDVVAGLYLVDENQTVDYKTHAALVTEVTNTENPEITFEVLKQEVKNINGVDWLFYDSTISSKDGGAKVYSQSAVYGTGGSDNKQFYDLTASSVDVDHYGLATSTLEKMVQSIRFYK